MTRGGPVLLLALLLAGWASVSRAETVRISRNIFDHLENREQLQLSGQTPVTFAEERWTVSDADSLLLVSSEAAVETVFLLFPLPGAEKAWRLTLVIMNKPGRYTFRIKENSRRIHQGQLAPMPRYTIGTEGLGTELFGEPGVIREIVVQDDGLAELRLRRTGGQLVLEVISPLAGGLPSGGFFLHYEGQPLTFVNYWGLLTGALNDNVMGELRLGQFAVVRGHAFWTESGQDPLYLSMAAFTTELLRSRYYSVWLEGGMSGHRLELTQTSPTITWAFGSVLHARYREWGLRAGLAYANGPLALDVVGGWQVLDWLSLILNWQSLEGHSGRGAGLALGF